MGKEVEVSYIPMDLDSEDFAGVKYHKGNFKSGINDVSYLCGIATGLLNTGLEKSQVESIICCIVKNGIDIVKK